MVYERIIYGKYISLRAVTEEDAKFILGIRGDGEKNKFVHAVDNDIEKEIQWIRKQREREGDYFFSMIRKSDNTLVGNIAICDIDMGQRKAELGRWVSYGSPVENLESVILAHDFAYNILGLDTVFTKTLQDNRKVVSFWKRFGGECEENKHVGKLIVYYNSVSRDTYETEIRNKFIKFLEV